MTSLLVENDKEARRPIGIDLFAGAGGLSLGFEQAGFDIAAAVEIDPIHSAVHEFNFPNCAVLCADVSRIDAQDIRQAASLRDSPIDVVFGGAPCQGFSLIGKRALDDPRNSLLREFVRLAVELDARYFVFENVKGLTIGDHRKLLDELIEEFQANGYEILLPYRVLNAAEFGVPQDRRRLFLVGAKKGLPLPRYPLSLCPPATTVWEAIGDLPDADRFPELLTSDWTNEALLGDGSRYAQILRGLVRDRRDYSYPRAWDRSLLTSSLRTEHTTLSQQRFSTTKPGTVEPVSRFLKLDPNGVCNTLRAGTGSDKGAFTSPRPIHPYAPRCITVREAARLHSYPDWFRLHVTKWHGFRQIGNSVPPLLGRAVASELISAMNVKPSSPRKTVELGDEALLQMTMNDATRYYGVSEGIMGKRLRPAQVGTEQLALAVI
jgi:DNA (cytosine-5)-methyltransferase 1